jgi:hypothetical protein
MAALAEEAAGEGTFEVMGDGSDGIRRFGKQRTKAPKG